MTQVSIAPVHGGPGAPPGLFVPGVLALIQEGGDILVVLSRDVVRIDAALKPPEGLGRISPPPPCPDREDHP